MLVEAGKEMQQDFQKKHARYDQYVALRLSGATESTKQTILAQIAKGERDAGNSNPKVTEMCLSRCPDRE